MPLPNNFSPAEHLQDILKKTLNREVREWFSDVGDENWQPDVTTPRASLRVACTHQENDTMDITILRMLFFQMLVKGLLSDADIFSNMPFYSMPIEAYQQTVKFLPQVILYFREDYEDVESGYKPIDAQIGFRIPNEVSESYTEAKAQALANKIRSEFAVNNGYRWRKGRVKASYIDKEKGYQLIIAAYSEGEAREIINKVLDLQNDSIDNDCLTFSSLGGTPPIVPPSKLIYGKSRRLPRTRPVGYVRFQWAELHLWGLQNPVVLVDRSKRRKTALVRV
jgi:hypothetical protein